MSPEFMVNIYPLINDLSFKNELIYSSSDFPALDRISPSISAEKQEVAALALVYRVLPEHATNISIKIDASIGPKQRDTFMVKKPLLSFKKFISIDNGFFS